MATSPPFTINESSPGTNDLINTYPSDEQGFRDTVESWFNIFSDNTTGQLKADGFPTTLDLTGKTIQNLTLEDAALSGATGVIPAGAVTDYAGTSAPTGWLFAYGQAVSRTTYAALYAAIGTTYGVGDGSTTFNLPDLRGRVVAGQDDMGGTSANRLTGASGGVNGDTLGGTGGAETHTLTTAEHAPHTHSSGSLATSTVGSHTHTYTKVNLASGWSGSGSNFGVIGGDPSTGAATSAAGSHSHSISGSTGSAGSGSAHNNVQPTIILNKIIKT